MTKPQARLLCSDHDKVYYPIDTFTMNGKKLEDVQAMGIILNDDGTVAIEITMFHQKGQNDQREQ